MTDEQEVLSAVGPSLTAIVPSPSLATETGAPSAFTPGPWVPSKFGFQVLTGDSWSTICTLKGGAEWEDGRGKCTPAYEWENQEANARLIAAAPAMYEALALAEQLHRDGILGVPDGFWDRVHSARRAAIAQAEGRS